MKYIAALMLALFGLHTFSVGYGNEKDVAYQAKKEVVQDFGSLIPQKAEDESTPSPKIQLERVSTAVPWPRGLAWVNGKLIVLARGRHRNAGGLDPNIPDQVGSLFEVDPNISEKVVPGKETSEKVKINGKVIAKPTSPPFYLYDGAKSPIEDSWMDRPYCTLVYDAQSQNFFICGYSGVDLPEKKFRKNATDSIHRYDLRTSKWYPVEMHNAAVIGKESLGYVVPNQYYPHHDPAKNAPPHGWLNGPDGGTVVGDFLYVAAKDNHSLVQYDLREIRKNPDSGPPASRLVLGPKVQVRYPGGLKEMETLGHSALEYSDGYIYIGYRTSSVVLRFPVNQDGELEKPAVGELIAAFEPWNPEKNRSANLMDIVFNQNGELFVSCTTEGKIWKVGKPDPKRPFYGNDQTDRPTASKPYVDLKEFTGQATRCGNILFDDQNRLYICSGNYDSGTNLAGVIYRAVE